MGNSASTAASGDFISAAIALRTEAAPEEDVDPQGSEAFWLRVIPPAAVPAPDLWSVIQPEHIREMRATNPRNLALAIVKVRAKASNVTQHNTGDCATHIRIPRLQSSS